MLLLLQQRCPGRSPGRHPVGHLQAASADGLRGHRGDRHALREEVSCAGRGCVLSWPAAPPQLAAELGKES